MEEGKQLIEMMTVGVSETTLAEHMQEWPDAKKAEGWQLIAECFRNVADCNPELEFGKSVARLNMLFHNSATPGLQGMSGNPEGAEQITVPLCSVS